MQVDFHLPKRVPSLKPKLDVDFRLYGRHHDRRHNSAADRPIKIKFGKLMQNNMQMTINRSKSKPEVEFQYGGRLFSETGSSFISTID